MAGTPSFSPHTAAEHPSEPGSVRLALVPDGTGPHRLDGAWWPRSRDLVRELPLLLSALNPRWGRVSRVTVNDSMWAGVPRTLLTDGRVVHLGSFTNEQNAQEICLLAYGVGRWDLLVIPSGTASASATRLLADTSAYH